MSTSEYLLCNEMRAVYSQLKVSSGLVGRVQTVQDQGHQDEEGVHQQADDPDVALVLLPGQVPQADNTDQ